MPLIYRTDGAWGTGKGTNLAPDEVDGNFYDITTRVTFIEENPPEPVVPIAINIEGSAFSMGLSDGSTLGPIMITYPMPTWRGDWNPSTAYNEMDFFIAPDGGLGAVMIPHTSAATFDWGALDVTLALPLYRQLIGGSGTTSGIADLVDVALGTQAADDMLVWDGPASLWRNKTPAVVAGVLPAFGGSTGSAAGLKGLVPAPAAGDASAGKVLGAGGGWIVPAGDSGGSSSLAGLADVAIVSPVNLSLLQYSSVDGKWHNQTLATLGAGTVTHVDTGAGLIGGPITGAGSISLEPIPTLDVLANVTGASAPAAGVSLSTLLDAVLGTARGSVLWRSATGWVALTAGTAGQFLRTGGTGADVTWANPAGAGTVTQVNSGTGLTGGPITATGTLSLATVSDSQVIANISGGVAAPAGTTLTLLLDHALGATQGMVLYRGAATWSALPAGASGAVLTSGGAAANPSWVTGSGSGTVTNVATGTGLIGGPITGTGTISFATVANLSLLANLSGSTAAPTPSTMSAILDAVFASTRGSVIYRGAAGWAALGAGTAGNVLTTGGAGADPAWAAASGGASISTSDTPPASPADGDAWWDSGGGQLYIRYDDGTSSQWVPASNQPGPQGPAGSANMSGMTAGQLPVAATATSVTSSIALPLAIANGGTGSTTGAAALTALGGVAKAGDTITGSLTINTNLTVSGRAALMQTDIGPNTVSRTGYIDGTSGNMGLNGFLQATGNVTAMASLGAGTTTPASKLQVHGAPADPPTSGTTRTGLQYVTNTSDTGAASIGLRTGGNGFWLQSHDSTDQAATYPLLLNPSGGIVLINSGSVGGSGKLTVRGNAAAGDVTVQIRTGPTGTDTTSFLMAFYDYTSVTTLGGIFRNGTNTVGYGTSSDERLKDEITDSNRGLDALLALKVSDYRMGETEQQGLLAQQVREHYPEAVIEGGDDPAKEPWMIDYGRLTPLLIKAVQELSAKVAALEAGK